MTRSSLLLTAVLAGTIGLGATAVAQQDVPYPVQARQGQFTLMQLNLGVLVAMMRGDQEFNQDLAQAAADNLVAISQLDQSFHWPPGTDNESIEGTLALPAIWQNLPDVVSIWGDFGASAVAMSEGVMADGVDGIRNNIAAMGGTCTACHDGYRADPG